MSEAVQARAVPDARAGRRIDGMTRDIARGAAVVLVVRSLGGALEFLLALAIARSFGAAGSGLFFIALTVATIGSVFARLGLDNAMLRMSAAQAHLGDWSRVDSVRRRGLALALAVSIAFTLAILGVAALVARTRPELQAQIEAVCVMALAIAPLSRAILYGELLKSVRRVFASQVVAAIIIPGLALLAVVLGGTPSGIVGAALAYVVAAVVASLCGHLAWREALRGHSFDRRVDVPWRELLDGSGSLLWVKSARLATGWLATGALVLWASTAEVGVFHVALRISLALGLLLMAVSSVVAPRFAALAHAGDRERLQKTAVRATLLVAVFGTPAVALLLLAPSWVLSWFGPAFAAQGAPALIAIALGQVVNLATGPVNVLLMMSGHESDLSRCVTASVLCGAALLVLLVPSLGALGAAIAIAVAMTVQNLGAAVFVHRRLGIVTIPLLGRLVHARSASGVGA